MSDRKHPPLGDMGEITAYLKKVTAIVREAPELAALAYAKAAERVRAMAMRPENRGRVLQLQSIAMKLDEFAAQATVPEVDPVDGEQIAIFSDDPRGKLPTEYDGVLADFEAAKTTEDGQLTDELEHGALFAQFQKDRRHEISRPVNVVPESATDAGSLLSSTVLVRRGGSSGTGSFVSTTGVSGPVVAMQETSIIRWDGRDGEELPCRIAISPVEGGANANYPTGGDGTNTYSYRPYFFARWGTGDRGTANEVYGDVGKGIQFCVHASRLYVNVGMDSFTATIGSLGPSVSYVAGAMYITGNLGFFAGSSTKVTRTRYIDELAALGTSTVVIPAFARFLLPPQSTVTGATGETKLEFQDVNGNNIYVLQFFNGAVITPIPISNDAYQVKVTNVAGAAAAYRLIFELSL